MDNTLFYNSSKQNLHSIKTVLIYNKLILLNCDRVINMDISTIVNIILSVLSFILAFISVVTVVIT